MKKAIRGLVIRLVFAAAVLGGGYFALMSSSVDELHVQDAKGASQCALFKAAGVLSVAQIGSLKGKEDAIVADGPIWTLPVSDPPIYVVDDSEELRLGPGYCYFSSIEAAQAAFDTPVALEEEPEAKPKSVSTGSGDGRSAPAVSLSTEDADDGTSSSASKGSAQAFFDQKVSTPGGYLALSIILIIVSILLTALANNVKRGKITFFWDFEFQALKSDPTASDALRRVNGGQGKVRVSVVLSVLDPSNPNVWLSALTAARKADLELQIRTVLFALLKAELDDMFLDEIMKGLDKSLASKLATAQPLVALCADQLVTLELVAFNTPEMAEATRTAWKEILDLAAELARIAALKGAGLDAQHIGAYEQGRGLGRMGKGIETGAAVLGEYLDDKTKSAGS